MSDDEKWPEHLASVKVDEQGDPIFTDAWTNEERLVACAIMAGLISQDVPAGRYSAPGRPNGLSIQYMAALPAEELRAAKSLAALKRLMADEKIHRGEPAEPLSSPDPLPREKAVSELPIRVRIVHFCMVFFAACLRLLVRVFRLDAVVFSAVWRPDGTGGHHTIDYERERVGEFLRRIAATIEKDP